MFLHREITMPSVLIQNGTIVNADSTVKADLLIDGAIIKEIRAGIPASAARNGRRRFRPAAAARRHRRAYASRHALRRHQLGR